LDGDVPVHQRFGLVSQFNEDSSIDVLLSTTSIGGLGLNLTAADTVIFVDHDWNPTKDLQAMDRAHRIGQKRVVNVYRLITRGTIEEKIMNLQRFKTTLANTIVNAENSSLASMTSSSSSNGSSSSSTVGGGGGGNNMLDLFDRGGGSKEEEQKSRPKKKGLEGILNGLGELWDKEEYEREYDVNEFIKSLS